MINTGGVPLTDGSIIKRQISCNSPENPANTQLSGISPVSSAHTDPFEVERSESPFSSDETKLSTPTNPMSRKSSNTDTNSNKSVGFDFTDLEGLQYKKLRMGY